MKFSEEPSENTSNKHFLPKHLSNFEFLFPGMSVVSSAILDTIRTRFLGFFSYPLVAGLEIFEVLQ